MEYNISTHSLGNAEIRNNPMPGLFFVVKRGFFVVYTVLMWLIDELPKSIYTVIAGNSNSSPQGVQG